MDVIQDQVIAPDWFARPATAVAPDLIGCVLVRQHPNGLQQRGLIVETEAYGPGDPACHGYRKQTPRNAAMFGPAGYTYVYFIYGIYHCLNLVTDQPNVPSAVLLRALDLDNLTVLGRSPVPRQMARRAAGPGKLCQVLQIDRTLNQLPLIAGHPLWVEHRTPTCQTAFDRRESGLVQTTRIGLTQGMDLPWRWYLTHSVSVSKR